MSKCSLSRWDENWLDENREDKWNYVFDYIGSNWPVPVIQHLKPSLYTTKNIFVRDAFKYLLQVSPTNARNIIRKTKEAWRSYNKNVQRKKSGSYTHIKLTNSDKNKMRKLANEVDLQSTQEVISYVLNDQYKDLLASKKAEREIKATEANSKIKVQRKASLVDVFSNAKLNELNKLNKKLESELKVAHHNLESLSELLSEQQILLSRYSESTIEDLTEAEIKQARDVADVMTSSLIKGEVLKLTDM
ncbi:MAG: hypothetical protein QNK36_20000 [Colwellia sp.]|nr:hypothetical protein [Colwellia sp.]